MCVRMPTHKYYSTCWISVDVTQVHWMFTKKKMDPGHPPLPLRTDVYCCATAGAVTWKLCDWVSSPYQGTPSSATSPSAAAARASESWAALEASRARNTRPGRLNIETRSSTSCCSPCWPLTTSTAAAAAAWSRSNLATQTSAAPAALIHLFWESATDQKDATKRPLQLDHAVLRTRSPVQVNGT